MLWEAANILRGPVDASDFKAYVFPLLFLKRISDVYDEERAEALAESDGDEEYAEPAGATSLPDPEWKPLGGSPDARHQCRTGRPAGDA